MKILLGLFLVAVTVDPIVISMSIHNINNMWVFHVFTLLEYSLLTLIFSYWQKKERLRNGLRVSILFFFTIWVVSKLSFENLGSFDNYTSSLSSLLLSGYALYTLIFMFIENPANPIHYEPKFWISTAVLVYYTGNLLTFALSSIIVVWSIHNILNILANLCYAGGFLCLQRK